jgi:hypothetical protein
MKTTTLSGKNKKTILPADHVKIIQGFLFDCAGWYIRHNQKEAALALLKACSSVARARLSLNALKRVDS